MATTDSLSTSILESVSNTNIEVLGNAPAEAVSVVYQVLGHSIGLAMQSAQSTNAGMMQIGTAIVSVATSKIMSNI
jgi:Killing trait